MKGWESFSVADLLPYNLVLIVGWLPFFIPYQKFIPCNLFNISVSPTLELYLMP